MEIGATKAVQDRLKTTKIEESKGASLVFCWDTHLTKIKGRNVLFIVNASNRYTIAMTDIEPRNLNYYNVYPQCDSWRDAGNGIFRGTDRAVF